MTHTPAVHPAASTDTTARRLLIQRMADPARRLTQQAVATKLCISQNSVSLWCRGISRPESHLRNAIRLWLGIPEAAWLSSAEADFLARFEQAVVPEA